MRTVQFNPPADTLTTSQLVDLIEVFEDSDDVTVPVPLRLIDGSDYSPYALYLDTDLGDWELVKDDLGQLMLVCVKHD